MDGPGEMQRQSTVACAGFEDLEGRVLIEAGRRRVYVDIEQRDYEICV